MKKQKTLSLLSILTLCLCSLFIGVWAAKTATVTTGGSINFTATGVNCKVSGAIQNSTASLKTLETLTFSASDESTTKSWGTANAIAFDNNETPINIVITVENLVDRALYAKVTDAVFGDGSQFDVTLSTDLLTLSTAGSGTITITITPKPMDISVVKDYSFNVELSSIKPVNLANASDYPYLTFTALDGQSVDGYQAVSVQRNTSYSASGDVIIPSYVNVNGTPCVVTHLPDGAFANWQEFSSIVLPETITSSGEGLFGEQISGDIYVDSAYIADTTKMVTTTSVSAMSFIPGVGVLNFFRDGYNLIDYQFIVYVRSDLQVGGFLANWYTYIGTEKQFNGNTYIKYAEAYLADHI